MYGFLRFNVYVFLLLMDIVDALCKIYLHMRIGLHYFTVHCAAIVKLCMINIEINLMYYNWCDTFLILKKQICNLSEVNVGKWG
jgi:hypothetical protein